MIITLVEIAGCICFMKPREQAIKAVPTNIPKPLLPVMVMTAPNQNQDKIQNQNQNRDRDQENEKTTVVQCKTQLLKKKAHKKSHVSSDKNTDKELMALRAEEGILPSRGTISHRLVVTATAYSACRRCCGNSRGTTATGHRVHPGLIAVDPRIIPFGSRVFVNGYGWAVADDTGGAIKGHRIDLYFTKYSDAVKWGKRRVEILVK